MMQKPSLRNKYIHGILAAMKINKLCQICKSVSKEIHKVNSFFQINLSTPALKITSTPSHFNTILVITRLFVK